MHASRQHVSPDGPRPERSLSDCAMKTKRRTGRGVGWLCIALTAAFALGVLPCTAPAAEDSEYDHEYRVKAAFMYNFLMFVDGLRFQQEPDGSAKDAADADEPVVIGIIGRDPFQDAFVPLQDRRISDRKVIIKHFRGFSDLRSEDAEITLHPDQKAVSKCDLLFIGSSEEPYLRLILTPIRNERVLTVAEIPAFIERGGMIGLVTERYRVRFEVNVVAAKRANLAMRSKLLRLAKRVIEEDGARGR
jgi:hypothetical protein